MRLDKLKELVLILISIILGVFLIKYLNIVRYLKIVFNVLIPVFIGFIYAWIFNPLIENISNNKNRNVMCILIFLLFLSILSIFIYFLIPIFYREIMEFIVMLPEYYNKLEVKIEIMGLKEYLNMIVSFIVDNVPIMLINFIKNGFKYLGVILIGLILGLYLSMDYRKIKRSIYNIVPKKYKCVVVNISQDISDVVRKVVNGTFLIASCVFVLDSICFIIIGLDAPILLGLVCGITDLIPYIGPYIGGAISVLVGFTESKVLGLITLLVCVIVQSIENYVLQPIVMSRSIKISPILVIVGLLLFGRLFGIIGMIFSTPFIAIIKVLFSRFIIVIERCKKKKS